MKPLEVLFCFLLISGSAFVSASEVALFSLSKFQLRALKERFSSAHRRIRSLVADPSGLLTTLLVSNELINILLSIIIAGAITRAWPDPAHGVSGSGISSLFYQLNADFFPAIPDWLMQTLCGVVVTTPIVVLFCDMTPKVIAARANYVIAPMVAAPLSFLYKAFKPIRWLLSSIVDTLVGIIVRKKQRKGDPGGKPTPLLREEEFMIMMEEGLKEGVINQNELELIRNVLELDDTRVAEIVTPIGQVRIMPEDLTVRTALNELRSLSFSRVPVVRPGTRHVTGVLYSKDLLLTRLLRKTEDEELLDQQIAVLMRKPMILPDSTPLNQVFRKMKRNQMHLAVIANDKEQTIGIVTMNDVLTALFEDILQ